MKKSISTIKLLFIYVLLLLASAYFLIFQLNAYFFDEFYFDESLISHQTKPEQLIDSCPYIDARESAAKGNKVYHENLSLEDIDRFVQDDFVRTTSSCASHIDSAKPKIIIIVTYRNRSHDLLIFLLHVLSYFRRQEKKIEIVVAEQRGTKAFNKGKLYNAAIREIDKVANHMEDRLAGSTCFALHDVDKIPDQPNVPYVCLAGPHQIMRTRNSPNSSKLMYHGFLGGVTMFSREQLEKTNGFSNTFLGWGGEDDDLWRRVRMAKMTVLKPPAQVGMFYEDVMNHPRKKNRRRRKLLRRPNPKHIMETDGLEQVTYTLLRRVDYKSFVWFLFDV